MTDGFPPDQALDTDRARLIGSIYEVVLRPEHFDSFMSDWGDYVDQAARRLGEVRQVVCASPGYLAARGRPGRAEELAGHDCITFENLMPADRWTFGAGTGQRAVPVRPTVLVSI